jgi:molybdopterin converting factor small subunit
MTLRIALAHVLAEQIGGEDSVEVGGATVGEALQALTARHPQLASLVWREGRFNDQLVAFLNRDDVRRLQAMETPVRPGDELMLITAVEGG